MVTGGYVQSVDFSPDGAMLVVGGADGALSFWSADTLYPAGASDHERIGNPSASWWAWFTPAGEVSGLMPTPALMAISPHTAKTSPSPADPRSGSNRHAGWRAGR